MGIDNGMDIEELLNAASRFGPASTMVKPDRIGTHNIQDQVRTELTQFEKEIISGTISEHLRRALEAEEGLIEEEGRVYLTPIVPITGYVGFPVEIPDPRVLIHRGVLFSDRGDNLMNLQKHGVFGDPREDYPTYLKRPCASAYTLCSPELTLRVDREKLLEMRTVFFDPEAINNCHLVGDVWKNSYFVVGGIPKEAILEYKISRVNPPKRS